MSTSSTLHRRRSPRETSGSRPEMNSSSRRKSTLASATSSAASAALCVAALMYLLARSTRRTFLRMTTPYRQYEKR